VGKAPVKPKRTQKFIKSKRKIHIKIAVFNTFFYVSVFQFCFRTASKSKWLVGSSSINILGCMNLTNSKFRRNQKKHSNGFRTPFLARFLRLKQNLN